MNFLNLPTKKVPYNQAKALILPVPCSGISRGAQGMDKGPEAILQASQLLSDYDVETNTDLNELGLHTLDPLPCPENPIDMVEELANQTSAHFKRNKLVAAIGGSHLISEGLVSAAVAQNNDLSVIHLGAHPHLWDQANDKADVMARIKEKCAVSHIGIRSMTKVEKQKIHLDNLVFARDIYNNGLNAAADALDVLSDNVYLAINLDILDPTCMPAVIKPEPGGLDWYALNNLIRMLAREKSIVGFDVTGLMPQKNGLHAHLLAAKLVYKTLICCLKNSR
ncbi:MAG: arginase family protein [Desulfobulbus sp.]|nr:arginase family protein [Desulfobulbus sp.]